MFTKEEAIITLCNYCFDLYLIINTVLCKSCTCSTQSSTPLLSSSRSLFVRTTCGFGLYCLTPIFFLILLLYVLLFFLLFSVLLYLLTLSHPNACCLPACLPARGFKRLPKSRKRRCVIKRGQGRASSHSPSTLTFFFYIALSLDCVSTLIFVAWPYKIIVEQSSTILG